MLPLFSQSGGRGSRIRKKKPFRSASSLSASSAANSDPNVSNVQILLYVLGVHFCSVGEWYQRDQEPEGIGVLDSYGMLVVAAAIL